MQADRWKKRREIAKPRRLLFCLLAILPAALGVGFWTSPDFEMDPFDARLDLPPGSGIRDPNWEPEPVPSPEPFLVYLA